MVSVDVYTTRTEIYPYYPGEHDPIINQCSTAFDKNTFKKYQLGCMYIKDRAKLVVMRGLSINWLHQYIESYPTWMSACISARMKYSYKMTSPPRNKDQIRAIKFLLSYGEFTNLQKYSQLALNTEPAFGKTFCTVAAALERGKRTLIITHNTTVLGEWIKTLKEFTTVPAERVLILHGTANMRKLMEGEIDTDIILALHQSLAAFIHSEGYERSKQFFNHLECGTKIVDEAHLFFQNTIQIDFCTNIERNFYLTGTMERSNPIEVGLFRKYFSTTPSFGAELEKTKNVVYTFLTYDSCPTLGDQASIMTRRGPNSSKFIDYALKRDAYQCILSVMFRALELSKEHPGKIMIAVPKISVMEYIKGLIEKRYPEDDVRTIHSKNTKDVNEDAKRDATIILSTISGTGTGADIKGLRNLIVMDLYSSDVLARQLPKRLRPWENGEASFCYEITDCGFESINSQVSRKTRTLKKYCKSVKTIMVEI